MTAGVIGTILGTVLTTGRSAQAVQIVVADVVYTHSATTTMDSHYRVSPAAGTPKNLVSPADYSNGSAHVRLEVKTKPNTTTDTCFQVCFEATQNYGCVDISKPYKTTGLYEWDTPFSRFYKPGPIPWDKGIVKVALLLKDTKNVKVAPENVGAATSALYMPTDLHVIVTLVAAGSTYVPAGGIAMLDGGSGDGPAAGSGGNGGGGAGTGGGGGAGAGTAGRSGTSDGGTVEGTGGAPGSTGDGSGGAAAPVMETGGAQGSGGLATGGGSPSATGGAVGSTGGKAGNSASGDSPSGCSLGGTSPTDTVGSGGAIGAGMLATFLLARRRRRWHLGSARKKSEKVAPPSFP
ncbi:MAG: hypothetical protein ABIS92_16590 [Polyangia bacterium]